MYKAATIEEFHALLTSESQDKENLLLKALRELMNVEKPEDIVTLVEEEGINWGNWAAV
jgi:hypothetical protein